ncbi:hypothetical protein E2562_022909 [Oryza meyeriana var. granulata]|uniref:DUF7870 domain-containing protein n=1 Tax=Oryza meyeriana var. granulata TaxID=110450 RepID=A0A6G1D6Q1_9ORYZ|nr:hypothetical protein E2562_022909 [Oryza meyeriana var. granulata]
MATMKKAAREGRASNGRLLRLVARTALLAVVMLSLASLRLALSPAPAVGDGGELYLPVLLAELSDRGYLRHGSRAVFVGDAGSWAPFLERHHVAAVGVGQLQDVADESVDVVIFDGGAVEVALVNRILKVGGVAAAFVTSESTLQQLPDNYKAVFAHRSEATIAFALEKTGVSTSAAVTATVGPHRKLLALPGNKKDALAGLEAVLLEPPQKQHRRIIRRLRPRYLPELTGDSLEGYRRRTFIDVTPSRAGAGAASWFKKHYPRGKHEFDIVRLNAAAASAHEAAEGIAEWLEGNVREDDYVVVKAGMEAVEEILRKRAAVRRVDELFLDCDACAGAGADAAASSAAQRPYWECVALYGRLRDHGVAVHQWWELMNA